jgi:hypothetical protein
MMKGFSALAAMCAGVLLIGGGAASAQMCPVQRSGVTFSAEELVEASTQVFIVEVSELTPGATPEAPVTGKFRVVEALRGQAPADLGFTQGAADAHNDSDFEGHSSNTFWTEQRGGGGRSVFVFGTCGPAHAFKQGVRYLLFADMLGAMKSAEIIRSPDDQWLKFVRERIAAE